jgi:hypothetical protein
MSRGGFKSFSELHVTPLLPPETRRLLVYLRARVETEMFYGSGQE